MMTLEYYTYTQGAVITTILNAIATFFNTENFASLMLISAAIGTVLTTFYFAATRNPKHLAIWAAIFTLMPACLIETKVRMQIIDMTEPHSIYSVDNVPLLVALPSWAATTFMVGITDDLEALFTTVDDERYGRTGMMFGSSLYRLSRQSTIKNLELRKDFNDFFKSCLIDDVVINRKYTWSQLFGAPDIFAFLDSQSMSPLRGIIKMDGTFKTCREEYPSLKQRIEGEATDVLGDMATYLYGPNAAVYQAHLNNALNRSYDKYIGISDNAVNILKQNMAMNALRYGINTLDPSANAMNYAYTANKMQQTSAWATLGMQAREFLPMMQTLMLFVFCSVSFLVAAAAMIPSLTKLVLVNYLRTFFYLATWPMLFAILNGIMTISLEQMSIPRADPFNGLSLSNANALDELHQRFGYMTGFLMMSIPILAGKVLSGGAAVVQGLNYQLASMINATNTRVSQSASTGNIDFGNLQMQNHSFNNTNANKFDENLVMMSGVSTIQNPNGSLTKTYHGDGNRHTYHAENTQSTPLWSAQVQSMVQNSVQDQYTHAQTKQTQHMTALSDNISKGLNISDRWNDNWTHSQSYGDGHTHTTDGTISQGQSQMQSAVNTLSETTGWTKDQSRAYLHAASAGIDVGTGKVLGLIGANAGVKWSDEEREAYSNMTAEQKQALTQSTQQFTQGANSMVRAAGQVDTKENRTGAEQYAHDFAINYQRNQSLATSVNQSNAVLDTLTQMNSTLKTDSATFNQSAIAGFQDYLEKGTGMSQGEVANLMTARTPEQLAEVKGHYQRYMQSDSFIKNFDVEPPAHRYAELQSDYITADGHPVTLTSQQKAVAADTAASYQGDTETTVTKVKAAKGSDDLFYDATFRNARANIILEGGHFKGQAEAPPPSSSNGGQSELQTEVNNQIDGDLTPTKKSAKTDGYQLHDQNPNKSS